MLHSSLPNQGELYQLNIIGTMLNDTRAQYLPIKIARERIASGKRNVRPAVCLLAVKDIRYFYSWFPEDPLGRQAEVSEWVLIGWRLLPPTSATFKQPSNGRCRSRPSCDHQSVHSSGLCSRSDGT